MGPDGLERTVRPTSPARTFKRLRRVAASVPDRFSRDARRWLGAAAVGVALFAGSAVPLPPRHNPDFGPYGPDKFLHLAGHAGFAAALAAALGADSPDVRAALVAVGLSTAYGVSTELLQKVIPGREFERGDVVAGLVGSVLGVVAWRCLRPASRTAS